jgi:hypothetical protein
MPSDIEIANLALGNIRARSIQSFDEGSLEAQVCLQRYDQCRRFLLNTSVYNFARKVEPLALLDIEPTEWIYAYQYPSDCLQAKHIVNGDYINTDRTAVLRTEFEEYDRLRGYDMKTIPFEISVIDGVKVILTDYCDAYLSYIEDITNTLLFDDQFIEAFQWYLSAQIAVPIVGAEKGREMRKDALQMYEMTIKEATATNANERGIRAPRESDLTIERMS